MNNNNSIENDHENENFEQYINAIIEQTADCDESDSESEFDFEQYCDDLDTNTSISEVSSCSSISTTTTLKTEKTIATISTEKTTSSEEYSIKSDDVDKLYEIVLNIMDTYPFKTMQMFCDKTAVNDLINYTLNEILINCEIPSHLLPDDFPEFIRQIIPQYKSLIYDLDSTFEQVNQKQTTVEKECVLDISSNVLGDVSNTEVQLAYLRSRPQHAQRTPDWYQFRMNLLSASNYYKVMGSQAAKNSIIHEKCKQYNTPQIVVDPNTLPKSVNVETPMHWGQKYEPMSVLLYEHEYNTQVEEFGCIQHSDYYFIGASPDGINCCQKSLLYGRMLEIKNVVSRIITGEPKKEYFAQMQLQMEVCNLNTCDFLETKFVEYENYSAFVNDSYDGNVFMSNEPLPPNLPLGTTSHKFNRQHPKKRKGSIVYFAQPNGEPFYVYMPVLIETMNAFNQWIKETIDLYTSEHYNYSFVNICYWKLEVFNVVLVLRDKSWFASTLANATEIWKTIEVERLGDYSHRMPQKRNPEVNSGPNKQCTNESSSKCLLTLSQDNKNNTSNEKFCQKPNITK
jgi:putative phage-type endonuclease